MLISYLQMVYLSKHNNCIIVLWVINNYLKYIFLVCTLENRKNKYIYFNLHIYDWSFEHLLHLDVCLDAVDTSKLYKMSIPKQTWRINFVRISISPVLVKDELPRSVDYCPSTPVLPLLLYTCDQWDEEHWTPLVEVEWTLGN